MSNAAAGNDRRKYLMTKEGYHTLETKKQELEELREQYQKEKEEAREKGDLSENNEYDTAQAKVNEIDAEIRNIKERLSNGKMVSFKDPSTSNEHNGKTVFLKNPPETCEIGTEVHLRKIVSSASEEVILKYKIVGTGESDIEQKKIVYNAPLACHILDRPVGYKFTFNDNQFEIINITPMEEA